MLSKSANIWIRTELLSTHHQITLDLLLVYVGGEGIQEWKMWFSLPLPFYIYVSKLKQTCRFDSHWLFHMYNTNNYLRVMYCFQLLLTEIIWPFALRFGIGNEFLEPLTPGAVALMFANINNYLMRILQDLWPEGSAIAGEYWNEQRNTGSSLLLQMWLKMSLWLKLLLS